MSSINITKQKLEKAIIIIPSRLGSTRLPDKVIKNINGMEMVVRVAKIAQKLEGIEVFVATDAEIVSNICSKNNIKSILVQEECASGTDRVNIALDKIEKENSKKYDYILNLQADMPNVSVDTICKVIENCVKNTNSEIETAVVEITENEENKDNIRKWKKNPGTVKCILTNPAEEKIALYSSYKAIFFSREPIPFGNNNYFSHLGIYCYKREALKKFCSLKASILEKTEKLEQLRALENNINIFATIIDELPISVDTRKDLILARKVIF
jgi:3-deoxy-manno-octulosonate cytidylyltransferase (CMP-KDO synthetase)